MSLAPDTGWEVTERGHSKEYGQNLVRERFLLGEIP